MIEVGDWWEPAMFLLLRGPRGVSRYMHLYVQGTRNYWTSMIAGGDELLLSLGHYRDFVSSTGLPRRRRRRQ